VNRPMAMRKEGPIQTRKRKPKSSVASHSSSVAVSINSGVLGVIKNATAFLCYSDHLSIDQYANEANITIHDPTNAHIMPISAHQMNQHPHIVGHTSQHSSLISYAPPGNSSPVTVSHHTIQQAHHVAPQLLKQ
ncbi:hypothetical protein Anas_02531, partial [Armadillidium nasatum]